MPETANFARDNGNKAAALLQSDEEWAERNEALSASMVELIECFADFKQGSGLDVGCQKGDLTDSLAARTGERWRGIDPLLEGATKSRHGSDLSPGSADSIPFEDESFDCLLFANVFEHIRPDLRVASLREMMHVLDPEASLLARFPILISLSNLILDCLLWAGSLSGFSAGIGDFPRFPGNMTFTW